ncbi:MAG: LicD family protein [Lachnospiraceae bacterium]|nr:LicD family protein [Lachnospiraceae bacterium]
MQSADKEKIQNYLARIQEINYRMLCDIDRVCSENGIRYYLLAGTLLGVLRHKDFIPWDDDVDIVFARKDYEKFLKVYREQGAEGFEIVDHREYPEFFDFISRVVDKNTVVRNIKADDDYYGGRYSHPTIDLFIYDNVSGIYPLQLIALQIVYALAMGHRQKIELDKYSGITRLGAMLLPAIGRLIPFRIIAKLYDRISAIGSNSSKAWFISNDQQRQPYWGKQYKKQWFKKRVKGRIRDRFFPCPKGAKAELKMIYGDYMALPPEDKRYPEHFSDMELFGKENMQ